MTRQATPSRWRLRKGLVLRSRILEGEVAVLDEATAATHLLAPEAALILDALAEGEADLETLAARLGGKAYTSEAELWRHRTGAALQALRRIDLVEEVRG